MINIIKRSCEMRRPLISTGINIAKSDLPLHGVLTRLKNGTTYTYTYDIYIYKLMNQTNLS